jgi:hypothetical protein
MASDDDLKAEIEQQPPSEETIAWMHYTIRAPLTAAARRAELRDIAKALNFLAIRVETRLQLGGLRVIRQSGITSVCAVIQAQSAFGP